MTKQEGPCQEDTYAESQNKSEEQIHMSEGTSPSSTSDDGSRSTPSNLPKAAIRTSVGTPTHKSRSPNARVQ